MRRGSFRSLVNDATAMELTSVLTCIPPLSNAKLVLAPDTFLNSTRSLVFALLEDGNACTLTLASDQRKPSTITFSDLLSNSTSPTYTFDAVALTLPSASASESLPAYKSPS